MILKNAKPIPIRNGRIYWHLDESHLPDLGKDKTLFCIQTAFSHISKHFGGVIFEPTNKEDSPITIRFRKNGDPDFNIGFAKGQLGSAYPYTDDIDFLYKADLFLNNEVKWYELHKQGGYNLIKVLVHELFHTLGLDHCTTETCINWKGYKANDTIIVCDHCDQTIKDFYKIQDDLKLVRRWINKRDFLYKLDDRDIINFGEEINLKLDPRQRKTYNISIIKKKLGI